jgi:hypothetical protein
LQHDLSGNIILTTDLIFQSQKKFFSIQNSLLLTLPTLMPPSPYKRVTLVDGNVSYTFTMHANEPFVRVFHATHCFHKKCVQHLYRGTLVRPEQTPAELLSENPSSSRLLLHILTARISKEDSRDGLPKSTACLLRLAAAAAAAPHPPPPPKPRKKQRTGMRKGIKYEQLSLQEIVHRLRPTASRTTT